MVLMTRNENMGKTSVLCASCGFQRGGKVDNPVDFSLPTITSVFPEVKHLWSLPARVPQLLAYTYGSFSSDIVNDMLRSILDVLNE